MKRGKGKSSKRKKSMQSRKSGHAPPSRRSVTVRASQHIPKLNEVHPHLRAMVNHFLEKQNIPLKVHTMRFAEDVVGDHNCCLINGEIVCGPECP